MLKSTKHIFCSLTGSICLLLLFAFFSVDVKAQNTKGDRPSRETRFSGQKSKSKKPLAFLKKGLGKPAKRLSGERAGKPIRPIYQSRPSSGDVVRADNPRRKRVVVRSASSKQRYNNVYGTRRNPYVSNARKQPSRNTERLFSAKTYRQKVVVRSSSVRVSKQKNFSPYGGNYRNYRSPIIQKPVSNRTTVNRLKKIQSRSPYAGKSKVSIVPRSASSSFIRSKSLNPFAGFFRVKRKGEVATDRDIAGRPLRTKNYRSAPIGVIELEKDPYRGRKRNQRDRAYQGGPINGFAKSATKTKPKAWSGDIAGRKIRGKNFQSKVETGSSLPLPKPGSPPKGKKVKSGFGAFKSKSSSGKVGRPIPTNGPGANAGLLAKFQQKLTGRKTTSATLKKSRGKWNNNGQPLPARQGGVGSKGNLFAGNLKGNKPLKGGGSRGGHWNNAGRPITARGPGIGSRGANYSGTLKAKRPLKGGGSISGKLWNNSGQPIIGRSPGISAKASAYPGSFRKFQLKPGLNNQGENFSGNLKATKPIRGGGSRSGKWNNGGQPISPRSPGIGSKGINFAGNIKTRRPLKGGGSISGKLWNNNGQPVVGRSPGISAKASAYPGSFKLFELKPSMSNQGENFAGFTKAKKPLKGGGSISNQMRNNNFQPISPRAPGIGGKNVNYSGFIKSKKPVKGGGSVSGKLWNNNNQPISPRAPGIGGKNINYSGYLKSKKPIKGGGSVSGKLWNNNNAPIPVRTPPEEAAKAGKYQGSFKKFELHPGMSNQGEEFTGFLRRGKYGKAKYQNENAIVKREKQNYFVTNGMPVRLKQPGWARNQNAHEKALLKRDPSTSVFAVDGLQIRLQTPGYKRNKNAAELALLKKKPIGSTLKVGGLTTRLKQPGWARNKNAHEDALMKRDPSTSVFATGSIYGKVKAYSYRKNPSAASAALRVREPGKAFAKASSYQGNIKMKKFEFLRKPNYHPDFYFVKTNKNNVKEERNLFTNIKLLWAKWFRKNQTQPDNIKEKTRKPRYDKREIGIWYD